MAEDEKKASASTRADLIMEYELSVVEVTAVDHRFWLDFLRIYMSVVSGDGFFNHHDDVGSSLCRDILFFLTQPLSQRILVVRGPQIRRRYCAL